MKFLVSYSEDSLIPFSTNDIKVINNMSETIKDPILRYLYILKNCRYYVIKAPINDKVVRESYGCIITKTEVIL